MSRSQSQQPDSPSSQSYQPWSESVRLRVVAARDLAWGDCKRGVTRIQKFPAIQRFFREAEWYESRWEEARVVFEDHREGLRIFLRDPVDRGGIFEPAGIQEAVSAREVDTERPTVEGQQPGTPSSQSQQPWSESILRQVVAARDRAWGECQGGVTRAQKYRAIER